MKQSIDAALGDGPDICRSCRWPAAATSSRRRQPLKTPLPKHGQRPDTTAGGRSSCTPDAVTPAAGQASRSAPTSLFVRGKLDDRLVDDLHAGLREAIVAARLSGLGVGPGADQEPDHGARARSRAP